MTDPVEPRPRAISYEAPHHLRPVIVNDVCAGTVRQTMGGHWQAYSYRRGCGVSPLANEAAANAWVREQHAKGPIARYSR